MLSLVLAFGPLPSFPFCRATLVLAEERSFPSRLPGCFAAFFVFIMRQPFLGCGPVGEGAGHRARKRQCPTFCSPQNKQTVYQPPHPERKNKLAWRNWEIPSSAATHALARLA